MDVGTYPEFRLPSLLWNKKTAFQDFVVGVKILKQVQHDEEIISFYEFPNEQHRHVMLTIAESSALQ
jgi:hypothetical protein